MLSIRCFFCQLTNNLKRKLKEKKFAAFLLIMYSHVGHVIHTFINFEAKYVSENQYNKKFRLPDLPSMILFLLKFNFKLQNRWSMILPSKARTFFF